MNKHIAISVKVQKWKRPRKEQCLLPLLCMANKGVKLKKINIVGKKIGRLLVTEMRYGVLIGTKKRTCCICKCDCGNEILTTLDSITSGGKTSCRCDTSEKRAVKNRKDLTDLKFGRLTVLEMDYSRRPTMAVCRCECGNIISVRAAQLSCGKTQSCGCLRKDRVAEVTTKDWFGVISTYGIKFIKRKDKNKQGQWLWECECGLCGNHFVALPAKIMNGHITSCGCRKQSSKEQLIKDELSSLGVMFKEQFSFSDCKYQQSLLFDFAVFKNGKIDFLIEYDGQQHYKSIDWFGGKAQYEISRKRDDIKDNYCAENKIDLIRLPYTLSDNDLKAIIKDTVIRRDCNGSIGNNITSAILPTG